MQLTEILFVHPDEKLRSVYHQRMKNHFRINHAVDGLSAIRQIRLIKPRAVISEYQLPMVSGRGLIKFVRSFPPTAVSPFIFLTSHEFDPRILAMGANEWIHVASAHPEMLIDKIYYHLKLSQPYV